MIRLKDVAARAGVSLMTVSKVLRDAPDVSDATKSKIRQLAKEMGYVPDALARGLRTRQTRLFGLVLPSLTHPALGEIALAIEDRAHDLGYDLLVAQTQDNAQREEVCIRRLLARHIDGLFVYPVYRLGPPAEVYQALRQSQTPTVLLGHRAPFCAGFANVECDDLSASCHLTEHLIQLGHRRIAFFAGPSAAPWAQERFEGYRRALREAEIPWEDKLVFTAGVTIAHGEQAATQMLSEATEATAVQTVSDRAALGAAMVFAKHGVKVPADLSIAGFGNDIVAQYGRLPLTTVEQPRMALGVAATATMLRLLAGEVPSTKILPGRLICRTSTASPNEPRLSNPIARPADDASDEGDDLQ